MHPIAWMVGGSLVSWLVVTLAAGSRSHPEVFFGMLGPLASAGLTWMAVERRHAAAPERVTRVLVTGLALKMVFFGLYVAVMLRLVEVRPVPFVVSFTGYFIGLHVVEALFLRRLLTDAGSPSR